MPFVLPVLGLFLAALVCLALAVVIDQLVSHVNDVIPNWSILGHDIFGWAHDILSGLHNWIVDISATYALGLRDLVSVLAYLWKRLESTGLSALGAAFALIHHLHDTTIPAAQNAAATYTNQQVGSAESTAASATAAVVRDLNTAENSLQHNIDVLQTLTVPADIAAAKAQVIQQLQAVQGSLQSNIDALSTDMTAQLNQAWNAIYPLQTAVGVTIPKELASQAATEASDVASARAAAKTDLQNATAALQAEIDSVNTEIGNQSATIAQAEDAINSLDKTSATYATDLASLHGQINTANDNISQLTATASSLQGQVTTNQTSITTLEATQIITLPSLPDITIPTSITVPLAVGALATAVASIITEIDRCMVTLCDGPNNYRNLFNTLMGGIDIAGLIAFMAEAVQDPAGEARAVAGVGAGIYNSGHALIDDLLSL